MDQIKETASRLPQTMWTDAFMRNVDEIRRVRCY